MEPDVLTHALLGVSDSEADHAVRIQRNFPFVVSSSSHGNGPLSTPLSFARREGGSIEAEGLNQGFSTLLCSLKCSLDLICFHDDDRI